MGKNDKNNGVVADYLAIMGSTTSLEIVNRIVDLSREDLALLKFRVTPHPEPA